MRLRTGYATIAAALLLALWPVGQMATASEGWGEDFDAAKAQAVREGKDLLVDFTGSDWCSWCIKLDGEVFSKEPFKSEAPEKYVLVALDYPRDKNKVSPKIKAQNEQLKDQYAISGYPTIFLMDAKGVPYAKTGYQAGGPEKYLKHLADLQEHKAERDRALTAAEKAEGVEKAKLLDEALAAVGDKIALSFYSKQADLIVELDADNKAGLKAKYDMKVRMAKVDEAMSNGDSDGALAAADKILEQLKPTGQQAQDVYFLRSTIKYSKKDKAGARRDLELALEAAPNGTKVANIKSILKRYFSE